jgi:hypothetical protein
MDAFLTWYLITHLPEMDALAAAFDLMATTSTSTTSLTVGTGAQSLTVEASKSYQIGMSVRIAYSSTVWMHGEVTSYNPTTGALVVNVTHVLGSGTQAAWTVSLSGPVFAVSHSAMWQQVSGSAFTATPASPSTITMLSDQTAAIKAGMTAKYTVGGVDYHGQVSAIAAGLLTVRGAPIPGDVSALYYDGGKLLHVCYDTSVLSDGTANTIPLLTGTVDTLNWQDRDAYVIYYNARQTTADTHATKGKFTVKVNGNDVNTSAGGLSIAANATLYETGVDINVTNYKIVKGQDLTLVVTQGGNANGAGLRATALILVP